jgi:predicted chitinase
MIDRKIFFATARKTIFAGRLTQQQVDGCNALLTACRNYDVTDTRHIAYILATVFHETGGTIEPVRETFATTHRQAMARLKNYEYARTGFYGRGLVQITHRANYERLGKALNIDLVSNPDLALDLDTAAQVCVLGMQKGLFTGKKLSDYFAEKSNPIEARRIVNILDRAKLIAQYYHQILDALEPAIFDIEALNNTQPFADDDDASPDGAELATDKTTIGGIVGMVCAGASGLLAGVDNIYALGAVAALTVVGGFGAWLFFTGRIDLKRRGGV